MSADECFGSGGSSASLCPKCGCVGGCLWDVTVVVDGTSARCGPQHVWHRVEAFKHNYFIVGSWTSNEPVKMRAVEGVGASMWWSRHVLVGQERLGSGRFAFGPTPPDLDRLES